VAGTPLVEGGFLDLDRFTKSVEYCEVFVGNLGRFGRLAEGFLVAPWKTWRP
jgi:hypothetical protein